MDVRITVSKSTCFLLGAAFGITLALITPSSIHADDKKKRKNNNNGHKNVATNTSKIHGNSNNGGKNVGKNSSKVKEKDQNKFYGDSTMSSILDKATSGIRKIWDQGWRVVLLNSKNSSNLSSDIYVDAQTSLPHTESQMKEIFDSISDSSDVDSTLYTPYGKVSFSTQSTLKNGVKKGLDEMAKGYFRANTSKNDGICKNFPVRQSTLIDPENESIVEENAVNENTEATDKSNSKSENTRNTKLVLSFRAPFSPVIKVFQAVKNFKRAKKRAKERNDANAQTNSSNDKQEVVDMET